MKRNYSRFNEFQTRQELFQKRLDEFGKTP